MKIFNLSHTDLDGYGSQMVLNQFFDGVIFENADYGNITEKLNDIVTQMGNDDILVITDLNIKKADLDLIKDKKVLIIDHHRQEIADSEFKGKLENNVYVYFDTSKCATMNAFKLFEMTFMSEIDVKSYEPVKDVIDFIKNNLKFGYAIVDNENSIIDKVAYYVDVYDMWRKDNKDFTKASFISNAMFMMIKNDDYTLFKRDVAFLVIDIIIRLYGKGKSPSDINVFDIQSKIQRMIINELEAELETDDTLSIIKKHIPDYNENNDMVKIKLLQYKEVLNKIIYEDEKIIVFDSVNSSVFQALNTVILGENPDKVIINLNENTAGLRSLNEKSRDIALLFGGGGHYNASGFRYDDFKKTLGELVYLSNTNKI